MLTQQRNVQFTMFNFVVLYAYYSCVPRLQRFTFLGMNLTMCRMLTLYFENSSFGVIMSWSGRDGSSHRKWTRGHLWYTSLTPHIMQHIL